MRSAQTLLNPGLFLTDGAMGTYYAQLGPDDGLPCEAANLTHPELIRRIHSQYLASGADLLRTNTFAAIAQTGPDQPEKLRDLVKSGFRLAAECAEDKAFVAADMGPAYQLDADQYLAAGMIASEAFLACGADLFIFETFSDPAEFLPLCRHIKKLAPKTLIMGSCAVSPDGLTRKGLSLEQISKTLEQSAEIDLWGLNCGVGPTHLAEQAAKLDRTKKPLLLLPNSGYPRMENMRLVYGSEPAYFARVVAGFAGGSVRLLGGCCGTTPRHIAALARALADRKPTAIQIRGRPEINLQPAVAESASPLMDRLRQNTFPLICELDPPRDSDITPLLAAARQLKNGGIDLITLADSPMARVKMDSVATAIRVQMATGLPVLPHLCCRDRNVNALRSSLLALHSAGIRQVLAITGDAIPESDRGFVKPVFNLNSIGLLELIKQSNQAHFAAEPLLAAAAVDPGVTNLDAELERCCRKQEAGAALFLSQPVFHVSSLELIRRMRARGMKVLVGLMPLVSYRNAQFLSHEVPGIRIPEHILIRFHPDQGKEEALETGLATAVELAGMIRGEADGLYLIAPFNRSSLITHLLQMIKVAKRPDSEV
ncbi:MAG: bifunctional homocysteine S-methyltransferase/methylenetetrahydrofolate reductase [Ruminococcaceae bacterium]|nr:bifunctional homocysteine S-methyltransferase/methylenetetrahydrofolate reductase [Oscillospiraceae bacterium]